MKPLKKRIVTTTSAKIISRNFLRHSKKSEGDSFYSQFLVGLSLDTEVEDFWRRHRMCQPKRLGILLQQSFHIRLAENAVGGKPELRQAIGFKRR